MRVSNIMSAGLSFVRLLISLAGLRLTLRWKVRKARKAFEKELINGGMSKKDAKRLGAQYSRLKDEMMGAFEGSILSNL